MPAGDYIEGLALFTLMLGGCLAGAWLVVGTRLSHLGGSALAVGYALVATLAVMAVHLVPGMLGILGRGSVIVATAIWLILAWALGRRGPPRPEATAQTRIPDAHAPAESAVARWVGVLAVGAVGVVLVAYLALQARTASYSVDFMSFQMPNVVAWLQSGSIWQVNNFLPHVAPGNYPNNGELLVAATALPWKSDFLATLVMYPYYALTGVATYLLARELGAGRAWGATAACVLLSVPVVVTAALIHGLVDPLMLFGFAAGAAFLLRHRRTGATADLVLAGLALGVSFGTKWYGVSSVAIVVAIWAAGTYLERRQLRSVLAQGGALVGLIALAGGVWMLRNWIQSGNPVFPVEVSPLGLTIFDAPHDIVRDVSGFTILGYVGSATAVWTDWILPQWRDALAAPAVLALLGLAAVLWATVSSRARELRGLWAATALGALAIAIFYSVTPYTAAGPEGMPNVVGGNSRYVIPAVILALALAAALVTRTGERRGPASGRARARDLVIGGLALAAMVIGIWRELEGLGGGGLRPNVRHFAGGVAVVLALAGLAWAMVRVRRARGEGTFRAIAIGATALLVVGAAGVGHWAQQRYFDARYLGTDEVIDHLLVERPAGQRVGLAGDWSPAGIAPVLPAFGPRFENEVAYIGEPVQEMLHLHEDPDDFVAAVERERIDLLVVGRQQFPPEFPDSEPLAWARGAGFEEVERSERFVLLSPPE